VRVPPRHAADASGLLTTMIQLGQAMGVAAFGSLFLTLDAEHGAAGPAVSGHALAITLGWLAAAMVFAAAAGIPLARTVAAARRSATTAAADPSHQITAAHQNGMLPCYLARPASWRITARHGWAHSRRSQRSAADPSGLGRVTYRS